MVSKGCACIQGVFACVFVSRCVIGVGCVGRGCVQQGCVCVQGGVHRMTDGCKNITFPQLRLRAVKTVHGPIQINISFFLKKLNVVIYYTRSNDLKCENLTSNSPVTILLLLTLFF